MFFQQIYIFAIITVQCSICQAIESVTTKKDGLDVDRELYPNYPNGKIYDLQTTFSVDNPTGVAFGFYRDEYGTFVSTSFEDCIYFVNYYTNGVLLAAGTPNNPGTEDGQFNFARFNDPSRMAYDLESGHLYVADKKYGRIRILSFSDEQVTTMRSSDGEIVTFAFNVQSGGVFPGMDVQIAGNRIFVTDTLSLYSVSSSSGLAGLADSAVVTKYDSLTNYMSIHNYPFTETQSPYVYSACPDEARDLLYVVISFSKNVILSVPMDATDASDANQISVLVGNEAKNYYMCHECGDAPSTVNGYFGNDPADVELSFPMHLRYSKLIDSLFFSETYPVFSDPAFLFGSQTIRRIDLRSKTVDTYIGRDFSHEEAGYGITGTLGGYVDGEASMTEFSYPISIDVTPDVDNDGFPMVSIADLDNHAVRGGTILRVPTVAPTEKITPGPTTVEQFYTAAPTTTDQFNTGMPTTTAQFSTNCPTTTEQFLTQAPTTTGQFSTTSPTTVSQFSTSAPTTVEQFLTAPPTPTAAFVTASPTTAGQFSSPSPSVEVITQTEPPSTVSEFVTSAPTTSEQFSTAAPTTTSQFVTSVPTTTDQFSTSAPTTPEGSSTASPTTVEQFFTQAPTTTEQYVTSCPTTVGQFQTASPTTTEQFSTSAPTTATTIGATEAPTTVAQFSTSAPTTTEQFSTSAPTPTGGGTFTEAPTTVAQFLTSAPTTAEQFSTSAPTAAGGATEAPTTVAQFSTSVPTTTEQFSTAAPTTSNQFVTSSPTTVSQFSTPSPSLEPSTRAPTKTSEFFTNSPTTVGQFQTASPTRVSEFVTAAPSTADQFSTPFPTRVASTDQPTTVDQFFTAAPTTVDQFSTSSPTTVGQFATEAPTTAGQFSTSAPTTTEEFVTSAPTTTSQLSSSSPTTTDQFITASPTSTSQFVTSVPTTTSQFSTNSPSLAPTESPTIQLNDVQKNDRAELVEVGDPWFYTIIVGSTCCLCCLSLWLVLFWLGFLKRDKSKKESEWDNAQAGDVGIDQLPNSHHELLAAIQDTMEAAAEMGSSTDDASNPMMYDGTVSGTGSAGSVGGSVGGNTTPRSGMSVASAV